MVPPYIVAHAVCVQVRAKALRTLNIAHTVGSQRSTPFPVEDLVRMLMFRHTAEATDFILQYGLNISDGLVPPSGVQQKHNAPFHTSCF